jgi:hypothetical protein
MARTTLDPTKSLILTKPMSEHISRKRTYSLAQLRDDFHDAQTQFVVLITQLHEENFTGSLQLNFNNGRICNVETTEKQRVP